MQRTVCVCVCVGGGELTGVLAAHGTIYLGRARSLPFAYSEVRERERERGREGG